MLRACFIGAGGRARSAHYPNVARLDDVAMVGVCELDKERLGQITAEYEFEHVYDDHRKMLDEVDPDVVYCIMNERWLLQPALDCLNAGKHIFIEKPPGANSDETRQLRDAAVANDVYAMVGYQRRFAAVTREAMRRVSAKGRVSLATTTFNKQMLGGDGKEFSTTLWDDVTHTVDLLRYLAGGEATEVTAHRDRFGGESRNCYTALTRFDNGASGVLFGNRASGGRVLGFELHGVGIGCYARIPQRLEVHEDNEATIINGWEVDDVAEADVHEYEGTLTAHRHFVECVREGSVPLTDLRDVVRTVDLIDRIEGPLD
jgi:virulence factor